MHNLFQVESEQKLDLLFEYSLGWRDERLKWNVSDYCGIEFIFLSINDIWVPEITIVGAHSSEDYREDYKKFIYVRFKFLEFSQHLVPVVDANGERCEEILKSLPSSRPEQSEPQKL
ncbi:hypothetical protein Aduo_012457 [Ancylostoma duodenale]